MISDMQEAKNQELIEEYDRLLEEQKTKFEEFLRFSVDSALEYKCTESSAEDWLETPEITAKLIIELQRQAQAVTDHLNVVNKAELTKDLRAYTENRFVVSHPYIYSAHVSMFVSLLELIGCRRELGNAQDRDK